VDNDQTVFIAACDNHRIVAWKRGDNEGHVVAGSQERGSGLHQLYNPTGVHIDNETQSYYLRPRE
jgi:hypothetical protein